MYDCHGDSAAILAAATDNKRGHLMRARLGVALATILIAAVSGAPAALADSSRSINWAGYAAHRHGVHFKKVIATWTQPQATCAQGASTYSAVWIGLGGYAKSSKALEQIGTELDCNAHGQAVSSAWYELVPSASHTTKLIVRPGDRIRAGVTVSGHDVHLVLDDLSRHRSFAKTMRASLLDTSSAEWILEAPSVCAGLASCQTLPLANFTSATISSAGVQSTTGHTGSIEDRHWDVSEISLLTPESRFVANGGSSGASAVPSALSPSGNSFRVIYRGAGAATPTASPARVTEGRLVHPTAQRR